MPTGKRSVTSTARRSRDAARRRNLLTRDEARRIAANIAEILAAEIPASFTHHRRNFDSAKVNASGKADLQWWLARAMWLIGGQF